MYKNKMMQFSLRGGVFLLAAIYVGEASAFGWLANIARGARGAAAPTVTVAANATRFAAGTSITNRAFAAGSFCVRGAGAARCNLIQGSTPESAVMSAYGNQYQVRPNLHRPNAFDVVDVLGNVVDIAEVKSGGIDIFSLSSDKQSASASSYQVACKKGYQAVTLEAQPANYLDWQCKNGAKVHSPAPVCATPKAAWHAWKVDPKGAKQLAMC